MKKLFFTLPVFVFSMIFVGCTPTEIEVIEVSDKYSEVKVTHTTSIELKELSDLAYNPTRKKLYGIGDKGYFYNLAYKVIDENSIKIDYISTININHEFSTIDAEGFSFNTEIGELILSTEGVDFGIFPLTDSGGTNGAYQLPDILSNATYKSTNTRLEAVTYHPNYKVLTATEQPINGKAVTDQTIYSLDGDSWNFKAENYTESSVTAIEVTNDNNILVLERAQENETNFYITLKLVEINDECKNTSTNCNSEVLYKSKWAGGNFEALTKVDDVYIISNDNQLSYDTIFKAFKIKQ